MSNAIETVPPRGSDVPDPLVVASRERIAESYGDWLSDESHYGPAAADRLVAVRSEAQVSEVLVASAGSGTEVTVSSGRTGIVGARFPAAVRCSRWRK